MKWINVADQKPPTDEQVLLFYKGKIRIGCYRKKGLPENDEIKLFIEQYVKKIVDQGDERYPLDLKPMKEDLFVWEVAGSYFNVSRSIPSFWMPLPYQPNEILDLA